jgi:hypothetical protein
MTKKKTGLPKSFVYGITTEDLSCIKIGHSNNPKTRLSQLQTSNAQKLNLTFVSDPTSYALELETYIHFQFLQQHIRGEWFHYLPDTLKILKKYTHENRIGRGIQSGRELIAISWKIYTPETTGLLETLLDSPGFLANAAERLYGAKIKKNSRV